MIRSKKCPAYPGALRRDVQPLRGLSFGPLPLTGPLVAALLLVGCGDEPAPPPAPRIVETTEVRAMTGHGARVFSGVLRAAERAELGFPLGGEVGSISVELGDRFEGGALLASLDDAQARAERASVEARLDEARAEATRATRDATRFEALKGTGALPESDIESALTRAEQAGRRVAALEADVERLTARLADHHIVAPFAGRVTGRSAEPSTVISPGQTVLSIAGNDQGLEAVVDIPDRALPVFQVGREAELVLNPGDAPVVARVIEVSAGARNGGLVEIVLALPPAAQDLLPGQRVEVRSRDPEDAQLLLPFGSFVTESDSTVAVFVIDSESVARRRSVRVAQVTDEGVAVLSGLKPGTTIASRGASRLRDGERVVDANVGVTRYND